MSLKQVGGNFYYYENRREGRRVISEYLGSGYLALVAERFEKDEAIREAAARELFERKKREIAGVFARVDRAVSLLGALANAELIAEGYHKHKRQWRKRRDGQNPKDQE